MRLLLVVAAVVLAVALAEPLTGKTYFPPIQSTCETNYALVDQDAWDDAAASCSAHTTKARCEKHRFCWWRDAAPQNQFYEFRKPLVAEISNKTLVIPTSATTNVSIPFKLLVARQNPFERVYMLYTAAGAITAYPVILETATKAFLINTGESCQGAAVAKLAIMALTRSAAFPSGKPLEAVIVPHAHYDEDGGAACLCATTKCYGSKYFNQYWDQYYAIFNNGIEKTNLGRISGYSLPFDSDWRLTATNPTLSTAKYGKINMPVEDNTTLVVDGVTIQFFLTPSESVEQLTVWLPDVEVIHVGDLVLFAQCNTYTWRGEANRNVNQWISTLQRVQAIPFKYLLGSTFPNVDKTSEDAHRRLQLAIDFLTDVRQYVINAALAGVHPSVIENSYTMPASLTQQNDEIAFYHPLYQQVRGVIETFVGSVTPSYTEFSKIPLEDEYTLMISGLGGVSHALSFVDHTLFHTTTPSRSQLLYAVKIGEAVKHLLHEDNSTDTYVHACMVLFTACRELAYGTYALSERNLFLTCAWENRPVLFAAAEEHRREVNELDAAEQEGQNDQEVQKLLNIAAGTEFYGEPRIEENKQRFIF